MLRSPKSPSILACILALSSSSHFLLLCTPTLYFLIFSLALSFTLYSSLSPSTTCLILYLSAKVISDSFVSFGTHTAPYEAAVFLWVLVLLFYVC